MLQPDLYHGRSPWNKFEGWYFKITNEAATESFSFIPGIFWGDNPKDSHSFLQVLEGSSVNYTYHQFSTEAFRAYSSPFRICLDKNVFSLDGVSLSIKTDHQNIEGELRFKNLIKWKDHFLSPGSMGYFNFIPFMQCYSQVCGMDLEISGELSINGRTYHFDQGRGYIEKNWGNAFPYSWIWIQSNSFIHSRTSLSCSIAHIPFWRTSFRGFLVGLYHEGSFYSFTTMNGSSAVIRELGGDVTITLENKNHLLSIVTKSTSDDFLLCNGPRDGKMVPLVKESLKGNVSVSLRDQKNNSLIMEGLGRATGIEYGGNFKNLY